MILKHFDGQGGPKKVVQCPHCNRKVVGDKKLQVHIERVHVEKKFECLQCGMKFKTNSTLTNHMRTHQEGRELQCPHCPKMLNGKNSLHLHIKRCHETDPLVCDECGKTCQNEQKLKTHRITHVKHEVLLCPYVKCQKLCNGKTAQVYHLRSVHGPKVKNHQCGYCPKMFSSPFQKRRHENSIHLGVKTLKCDQCDYASNFASAISEHIKAKHLGILFDCDYPGCSKSYDKKGNLDAHRWRVHKIPRPKAKLMSP